MENKKIRSAFINGATHYSLRDVFAALGKKTNTATAVKTLPKNQWTTALVGSHMQHVATMDGLVFILSRQRGKTADEREQQKKLLMQALAISADDIQGERAFFMSMLSQIEELLMDSQRKNTAGLQLVHKLRSEYRKTAKRRFYIIRNPCNTANRRL